MVAAHVGKVSATALAPPAHTQTRDFLGTFSIQSNAFMC